MTERKADLERRINLLQSDREGLSSTLDESADRIIMLEKQSREQDSLVSSLTTPQLAHSRSRSRHLDVAMCFTHSRSHSRHLDVAICFSTAVKMSPRPLTILLTQRTT